MNRVFAAALLAVTVGAGGTAVAAEPDATKAWLSDTAAGALDLCAPDLASQAAFEARVTAAGWPAFQKASGIPVRASIKRLDPADKKSPQVNIQVGGGDVKLGATKAMMTECRIFTPRGAGDALIDRYAAVYGDEIVWWARRGADGTVTRLTQADRDAGLPALVGGLKPGERILNVNVGLEGASVVATTGVFEKID